MKQTVLVVVAAAIILLGLYFFLNKDTDTKMQNETLTPATIQNEQETPTPTSQGKLNINAVCEGALAYMTFTDGESADTFVAECKEGKHPEVIEKYRADMNLGVGAEI